MPILDFDYILFWLNWLTTCSIYLYLYIYAQVKKPDSDGKIEWGWWWEQLIGQQVIAYIVILWPFNKCNQTLSDNSKSEVLCTLPSFTVAEAAAATTIPTITTTTTKVKAKGTQQMHQMASKWIVYTVYYYSSILY